MRKLLLLSAILLPVALFSIAYAQEEAVDPATMTEIPVDQTTDQGLVADPSAIPAMPETGAMPDGEILAEPICFNVINRAPYKVFGSFISNYYQTEDGSKARHRSNFRLEENQQAEFCTYGPFFEGRKLELVIRTLVPVFNCKTALTGDIVINGKRKPEGGTDTWAICL